MGIPPCNHPCRCSLRKSFQLSKFKQKCIKQSKNCLTREEKPHLPDLSSQFQVCLQFSASGPVCMLKTEASSHVRAAGDFGRGRHWRTALGLHSVVLALVLPSEQPRADCWLKEVFVAGLKKYGVFSLASGMSPWFRIKK